MLAAGGGVGLLIGVSLTYLAGRVLKLQPVTIKIANASKQVRFVVVLLVLELAAITVYRFSGIEPPVSFQPVDVYIELFRSGVILLAPLALLVKVSGQSLDSIGIRRGNTLKMIILGLAPSMFGLLLVGILAPTVGAEFAGLTVLAYGFAIFLPAGLSEEILWRGYVQTRLIAHSTVARGLLVTSLLFGLWHLPVNYITFGGIGEAFLASSLFQFPLGLAFGYIMNRSQNILPSIIYHVFVNLTNLIFAVSRR